MLAMVAEIVDEGEGLQPNGLGLDVHAGCGGSERLSQ